MKVLVLNNMAPFVRGGAEELCDHLVLNLRRRGVTAEAMRIPFAWNPPERLLDEMLIARSLRLWNIDRVIALKFPVYLAPCDRKVIWLLHQFRQAYDLFDAGLSHIPATAEGDGIRAAIRRADDTAFAEAMRIYTNSPTTTARLRRYNGFESIVLPPPLNDPELFTGGAADGYVLAGGRVNASKRQHLLVQALRYAPGVRLVVAGPPDGPADAEALRRSAAEQGVEDRVTFDLRFVPRRDLATLVNGASAVAYLPYDEDSVGYVTMEAFHAGKPVVTTTDAGGVLQIVHDGATGWVVEPRAEALATALASAIGDAARTSRMGLAARERLAGMRLTWPDTIEALLA